MSLTGNVYIGGQNLENTHPLEQIEIDLSNLQSDITTNTNNITTNTTNIATNTTNIATNTTSINNHTTNLNTLNTQCTDISYDLGTDTTNIANRLKISAKHTWNTAIEKGAQFILSNTSTELPNQYDTQFWSGSENQVANKSKIASEGMSVIMNTKGLNDGIGVALTGNYPDETRGLVINFGPNSQSKFCGHPTNSQFTFQCGSVYMESLLYIKVPNNTSFFDVYNALINNASAITAIQAVNTTQDTRLTNLEANNTTDGTRLTDLEYKTQKQTYDAISNTTQFTSRLWCDNDVFVVSLSYGTISLVENRIKILAIEAVNTTQSIDISNNASAITAIQGVNTTQDGRLTNIETKTDRITLSGSVLTFPATSTLLQLNQNLDMNAFSLTNVGTVSYVGWGGGAQMYIKNSSTLALNANLTGNETTGSVFEFRGIKGGAYNSATLSVVDLNLNGRTISNCPTISSMASSISVNTNAITTQSTDITALQTARSSSYTSALGTCTSVANETASNWNYFKFQSSNTALVTAPYYSAPNEGFRVLSTGVYKFRISFEHQKPTTGASSNSNTTFFMIFGFIDGTKISNANTYSIIPYGTCGNNVDNTVYAYSPVTVFSASEADTAKVRYSVLTDSTGTPRPNLIGCEYVFKALANDAYSISITTFDRNWGIKNVKWTLEYVTS